VEKIVIDKKSDATLRKVKDEYSINLDGSNVKEITGHNTESVTSTLTLWSFSVTAHNGLSSNRFVPIGNDYLKLAVCSLSIVPNYRF